MSERPTILAAKNNEWYPLKHCPECGTDVTCSMLCGRCGAIVYNAHGFCVATVNGPEPHLSEIRDFLFPRKAKPPPPQAKPEQKPVSKAKDERKREKYMPGSRPEKHHPWLWRAVYAVITLAAAVVTLLMCAGYAAR